MARRVYGCVLAVSVCTHHAVLTQHIHTPDTDVRQSNHAGVSENELDSLSAPRMKRSTNQIDHRKTSLQSSHYSAEMSSNSEDRVVELNIGGIIYTSFRSTLVDQYPNSKLATLVSQYIKHPSESIIDSKKRLFVDRNGNLFRFIVDFLRSKKHKESKFNVPDTFKESSALKNEAVFYGIIEMVELIDARILNTGPTVITLGYRGTFAFGRDGLADVKFRKLSRILVSGKVSPCKEVFQDSLNMSRDPDCGYSGTKGDRYSSRFFLKHNVLEQAFDSLYLCGYKMVGSCGSGTNSAGSDNRPGQDSEESKWQHYNEFIFVRM